MNTLNGSEGTGYVLVLQAVFHRPLASTEKIPTYILVACSNGLLLSATVAQHFGNVTLNNSHMFIHA